MMKQGLSLELRGYGGLIGRPELQQILEVRPRAHFCPVWRDREDNDQAMMLGYAGSAIAEVSLTMEIDRLERNRVKRVKQGLEL